MLQRSVAKRSRCLIASLLLLAATVSGHFGSFDVMSFGLVVISGEQFQLEAHPEKIHLGAVHQLHNGEQHCSGLINGNCYLHTNVVFK